jgi:hypothetical protein
VTVTSPIFFVLILVHDLFNGAFNSSHSVTTGDAMISEKWKGLGRKCLWPNLKSYFGTCMEGLYKTVKKLRLDSKSLGPDLNSVRLESETGTLIVSGNGAVWSVL